MSDKLNLMASENNESKMVTSGKPLSGLLSMLRVEGKDVEVGDVVTGAEGLALLGRVVADEKGKLFIVDERTIPVSLLAVKDEVAYTVMRSLRYSEWWKVADSKTLNDEIPTLVNVLRSSGFSADHESLVNRCHVAADEIERLKALITELLPFAYADAKLGITVNPDGADCEEGCEDCEWYEKSVDFVRRVENGEFNEFKPHT